MWEPNLPVSPIWWISCNVHVLDLDVCISFYKICLFWERLGDGPFCLLPLWWPLEGRATVSSFKPIKNCFSCLLSSVVLWRLTPQRNLKIVILRPPQWWWAYQSSWCPIPSSHFFAPQGFLYFCMLPPMLKINFVSIRDSVFLIFMYFLSV